MHSPALAVILGSVLLTQTSPAKPLADAGSVLRQALDAMGGRDAIRGLTALRFRDSAEGATHDQSPTPEPPFITTTVSDLITVDPHGEHVYRLERGPTYEQTFQIDGHEGWLTNGTATTRIAAGNAIDTQRRVTRRMPALLLFEADSRAETLVSRGDAVFEGHAHAILEVTLIDGVMLRLWIDRQTHLLSKHERPYVDASLGDAVEETIFRGYHSVGALRVPSSYETKRGPFTIRRSTLTDVDLNPTLTPHTYVPQGDLSQLPMEERRPFHAVRRLADRVYILEQVAGQNFNVLFINQDDGIVVIDAPETRPYRGLNERVIATIRQTLPGRPIRYVVPTHHHTDHGGGLRPYIAEGIPVVTTAANDRYVRRLATAPFRLRPDALALRPRVPRTA